MAMPLQLGQLYQIVDSGKCQAHLTQPRPLWRDERDGFPFGMAPVAG